ncbi:MAG: GNAT family N-acetyltransferase [Kiritimatiellia bacterium]|jgi:D-alanine-D-alanine ligase-like ATP-grasp enzyme/ribosomal protein S18 acetylase RimI-like enzyme|nr:GNAT family N-acetyltransferase [Kiritimatiellia bacterium]
MNIAVIHQTVPDDAAADERDVLDQATAVRAALAARGHAVAVLACTADLGNVRRKLELLKPDCVFNLVETLDGSGRLIHLAPAVWEAAGIPFTGSSAEALYLTTQKLLSKERMRAAGLPVPEWIEGGGGNAQPATRDVPRPTQGADWIVKSVWEHASVGLGDSSILRGMTPEEVAARLPEGSFAERFIDGREFNLALLAGPDGPVALPPAEIVFEDFPAGKPRIVGYPAKWDETSFEYAHTVRRFADPAADGALLAEMARLASRCWNLFRLGGYARVDFRVDGAGRPWILEVNANPCIAPDSGFAAALDRAGIAYADAMERIVRAAVKAGCPSGTPCGTPHGNAPRGPCAERPSVTFRYEVLPADVEAVREVTAATGFFHDYEIPVAVELAEERLAKGAASGYEFVLAECGGKVVGYTSFGPIPCTRSSFDWYWLAVRPEFQGFGFGRRLLEQVEARARAMGGTRLYCETSGRPQYAATRAFYERMGFALCELLDDYYDAGDGRATYVKRLGRA